MQLHRTQCERLVRLHTGGLHAHGEDDAATERIKEREYRPFRSIRDGYPRYIVSLDRLRDQQEGVHHVNAIDLFLGKVDIF